MMSIARALDAVAGRRPASQQRPGPIGIDVGVDVIHACQLRPWEGRFVVAGQASIGFPEARSALLESPLRLRRLLREGMRGRGFVGRRVVAAMPADRVRFMPITYRADPRRAGEVILKMLNGRVEGDIADYVVDYLPVRSNTEQEESLALAAVALRRDVLRYLDALTGCGFQVDALDIGPAAIRRLLSVLYTGADEDGETILVVNAGLERSYLSVISGRRLLFDQPVDFGERRLLAHVAKVLDLAEDAGRDLILRHGIARGPGGEADSDVSETLLEILKHDFVSLIDEINRVLIFTAAETRGRPIGRVCLLGSIARWPGAEALLRSLMDLPGSETQCDIGDLFVDGDGADAKPMAGFFPEMAVAGGLALRGLIEHV